MRLIYTVINVNRIIMRLSISDFHHFFLDLFFPNQCLVCSKGIFRSSDSICTQCFMSFEKTNLGNWIENVSHSEGLDGVYSGWYFNDQIQRVIHSLKYEERAKLGWELGHHLGNMFPSFQVGDLDFLVPVPLHSVKKRERGYNQAKWIAKGLSSIWGIPVDFSILKRKKYTETQTMLSSLERKENMDKAFEVKRMTTGLNIGIIDDVLTTGSTMSACAVMLKEKGFQSVFAITCSTPKLEKKYNLR